MASSSLETIEGLIAAQRLQSSAISSEIAQIKALLAQQQAAPWQADGAWFASGLALLMVALALGFVVWQRRANGVGRSALPSPAFGFANRPEPHTPSAPQNAGYGPDTPPSNANQAPRATLWRSSQAEAQISQAAGSTPTVVDAYNASGTQPIPSYSDSNRELHAALLAADADGLDALESLVRLDVVDILIEPAPPLLTSAENTAQIDFAEFSELAKQPTAPADGDVAQEVQRVLRSLADRRAQRKLEQPAAPPARASKVAKTPESIADKKHLDMMDFDAATSGFAAKSNHVRAVSAQPSAAVLTTQRRVASTEQAALESDAAKPAAKLAAPAAAASASAVATASVAPPVAAAVTTTSAQIQLDLAQELLNLGLVDEACAMLSELVAHGGDAASQRAQVLLSSVAASRLSKPKDAPAA